LPLRAVRWAKEVAVGDRGRGARSYGDAQAGFAGR